MGNEIYHYLGAYIEIKVKSIQQDCDIYVCSNGDEFPKYPGKFCYKCGEAITIKKMQKEEYPWDIHDLVSEEIADNLQRITPYYLFGTDTIIAKGNLLNRPDGTWLNLSRFEENEIGNFPNPQKLIDELSTSYSDEIKALQNSELVLSVTVKAGYVENAEY